MYHLYSLIGPAGIFILGLILIILSAILMWNGLKLTQIIVPFLFIGFN